MKWLHNWWDLISSEGTWGRESSNKITKYWMNEQSTSSRPGRVSSATSLSSSTSRLGSSYIKSWSTSQACMDLEQGPVLGDGEHSGHHCHLCHGDSVGVQLVRSRPALPQVHRMCLDGSEPNPGWGTEAKYVFCSSIFMWFSYPILDAYVPVCQCQPFMLVWVYPGWCVIETLCHPNFFTVCSSTD